MSTAGHKPFVHLHLHTQYSLLDGAIRIPDLVNKCAELNQPAVAVTDHGVMFSTVPFMRQAREVGVKPIIGCELYLLAEGDHRDKSTKIKPNHITMLAKNETGYKNLSKLVSEAYVNGFYYRPRVDMDLLAENADGLVCLSGCLNGVLARNALNGNFDQAEQYAHRLRDIFGEENFFVELQDHGLPEQKQILDPLYDIAQKLSLPMVATNDCHYLNADDYEAHDVLLCIGTGKMVADENRMRYDSHEYYIKSGEQMADIFQGKYAEAVDNTLRVAEMCNYSLDTGKYYLPDYQVPQAHTIDSFFAQTAREGLKEKLPIIRRRIEAGDVEATEADYWTRLDHEIGIISKMGFSGYFLIVWDFIKYACENNIPVGPGRGSGAGSLVAYSMGITGIDPIQYDLLFERFLNPERISMPDFDIDFCMRRRGEVIEYVRDKYGWKNVAQIITFGTLKARNAIRDVGRVMDLPYGDVDKVAKMVPEELGITLDRALEESPDLKQTYDSDDLVRKMIDIAKRLEGLTRHASTHAAGVVIAPKPLLQFLPLYKSSKDEITTQFDMNDVETIGLIKMDFLGLRTLTVLQDTIEAIKKDLNEDIDIEVLPDGDKDAYSLLSTGKTCGIFQFESRGMRELLMRYKPERLHDLSALNALYRPGPIKGGLVDDFIERKHGRKKVEYIHPEIEEITRETFGVILYQEQVMQIASMVAEFSLGEADILRRAMGKKKKKLMEEMHQKFTAGTEKHGLTKKKSQEIYDYIDKFSGYGFNKSHSTAYGLIAYQTAYLKAHYPPYFMAALMSSEMENSDRIKLYIAECQELGIDVRPPDINKSFTQFAVEDGAVRFSLAAVKNVGSGAVDTIVQERSENGPFTSLFDFCERVDLRSMNKRAIESMIKTGCFDSLLPVPKEFSRSIAQLQISLTPMLKDIAKSAQTASEQLSNSLLPLHEELTKSFEKLQNDFSPAREELVRFTIKLKNALSPVPQELERFSAKLQNDLSPVRAELAASLDMAYEAGQKAQKDRESGQVSLFGNSGADVVVHTPVKMVERPLLTMRELLANEKECLGFYLSGHPLSQFSAEINAIQAKRIDELHDVKGSVTVAGIITALRKRQTRAGKMMANLILEDAVGTIETLVFPDAFAACYQNLTDDAVVVVEGTIKKEADSLRLFATDVTPLSEHKGLERRIVYVDIDLARTDEMQMADLLELIKTNSGDMQMNLRLRDAADFDVEVFSKGFGISSSSLVMTKLQEIAGHENVKMSRQRAQFAIS